MVQVTLGLVELGWPTIIDYVLLLIWCHDQSIPIGVVGATIHLDDLHEARSSMLLSELLLELVEDRIIVIVDFLMALTGQSILSKTTKI